jgi:hypothetical protein
MKLFAIGDSFTQGFMSGAAAKAEQSYVKVVANVLGLTNTEFRICDHWAYDGLPVNIEALLRVLEKRFGDDIAGPIEWPLAIQAIGSYLDSVEDYWERGAGHIKQSYPASSDLYFHNSAVWGMRIADVWNLNARTARKLVENNSASQSDGFFSLPSAPFYRTVNRMLNPQQDPVCDDLSVLDWLEKHVTGVAPSANKGGVENLILSLGSNNVLGTALSLKPNQTTLVNGLPPHQLTHEQREFTEDGKDRNWNLWHPDHFRLEYEDLIERVDQIMSQNPAGVEWNVFVANVPHVTIIPLAKGLGEKFSVKRPDRAGNLVERIYFKYYGYFFLEEEDLHERWKNYLTLQEAVFIDDSIDEYNKSIDALLAKFNAKYDKNRYHLIDINDTLAKLAWKRNNGVPTYDLPEPLKFRYPPVNTKYYNATFDGQKNVLKDGGLFSLDGVHPTAIGQGIIASEFLKVMSAAGVVNNVGVPVTAAQLDWDNEIIPSDSLYQKPIALVKEIYEQEKLIWLIKQGLTGF